MAEVREILDRDTEHPDSRTSTVCLFENTGEQPDFAHPFQLEPHNSVATMLFRSLSGWFNRPETSGFHLWYDAVSDEESGLPEFLTPDMREWLGRHSRWSKMRPWTVFDFGKRTLIFRAGTAYEIEKYGPFVSEMQVFAGLRAEAGMTINGPHVKDSERPPSDADWFPQEGHVARTERNQLLDQVPIRDLTPYWRKKTRVKPGRMVVLVFLLTIFIGEIAEFIGEYITKITGIVLKDVWIIVFAGLLWGLFVLHFYWDYWWLHRRNRRLLKIGEVASGTVDHFTERKDNRSQDASLYRVQVTYSVLGATHTAKYSLFVSDTRAGALTRFAAVDRQVVVLFDPASPEKIVLPELLAFCG